MFSVPWFSYRRYGNSSNNIINTGRPDRRQRKGRSVVLFRGFSHQRYSNSSNNSKDKTLLGARCRHYHTSGGQMLAAVLVTCFLLQAIWQQQQRLQHWTTPMATGTKQISFLVPWFPYKRYGNGSNNYSRDSALLGAR